MTWTHQQNNRKRENYELMNATSDYKAPYIYIDSIYYQQWIYIYNQFEMF